MIVTDIRELKSILDIDPNDQSEDKNLNFYIEWAGSIIEEYLGRSLYYSVKTEYYKGTGTQKLLLRRRPVFPTAAPVVTLPFTPITVTYDENGYFGAASGSFLGSPTAIPYTYGSDYTLQIDEPNNSSRSAILIRINEYWTKPQVRAAGYLSPFFWDDTGSFQITYAAGFTVDTLPGVFRVAANLLASKLRYIFPLGVELASESYEERSISIAAESKNYLLSLVKPLLHTHRNWKF